MSAFVASLAAALVALALSPVAAQPAWEQPVYPTDAYLAGCEITYYDDGMTADCPQDGAFLVFDRDGQRFVNEAGVPLRAPNHWYLVTE